MSSSNKGDTNKEKTIVLSDPPPTQLKQDSFYEVFSLSYPDVSISSEVRGGKSPRGLEPSSNSKRKGILEFEKED